MAYKLTKNDLIDICSVCQFRSELNCGCRRCKYNGAPCDQAKERLKVEALEKIHRGEARPFEYNLLLDNEY